MEILNRTVAPPVQPLTSFSLPVGQVKTLANDARAHFLQNEMQEVIRFELVFPAGKIYEPAKGVSYFTSKLLMEGTTLRNAKQLADALDYYGASLECNQGFDYATLTLYCLTKHFPNLLPIVLEVLTKPAFPENEFAILKTRTIQNIAIERQKPAYLANEIFTKNVYGDNHPYTSGLTEADIKPVTTAQVIDFFNRYYSIPEAEIFVCGHFSESDKETIEACFGEIKSEKKAQQPEFTSKPSQAGSQKESLPMPNSMQAAVRVGGEFPLITHPDYLKLTVLNKVLGGYFGSRLMKNIREDKGFTYGIYSSLSVRKYSTLFLIAAEVNVANATDTIFEINKELKQLQEVPVPADELETVKNYMVGKFLNEINTVFDQCDRYKHIVLHQLPQDHFERYIQTIRNITPETLQELSRKYFSKPLTVAVAGTAI